MTTIPDLDRPLANRVASAELLARTPGSENYLDPVSIDYEAWNHVGDPLCEDLLAIMRERKLMGGDIYSAARDLESSGVEEAVRFFADVEAVPSWLDVDSLRIGARAGKRYPLGIMYGIHGALPLTYLDPATADVMGSTGRLASGGDFRRRFWETATGFVGALDVDGMLPRGDRWVQWVRIRLLHTMIRMGIHRGGRWPRYGTGTPISQLATAGTTYIFGDYRVNILEYFGGKVSAEERDGFALMWRWVSRIEGANNQLLGRTHAEEREIQKRTHEALFGYNEKAQDLMEAVVAGTSSMSSFGRSRRLNHAVAREVLAPRMIDTVNDRDVRETLGLAPRTRDERVLRAAARVMRGVNSVTRIPAVSRFVEARGQKLLDDAVARGLGGVAADFRGTAVAGRPTDS
ncbi:oxygenase MpaB family protein [Rhodococcus sp. SORGH_AS_0301]|uniref:oxygenase MpaB family protein n=1 Tax=Rhodococcus sp. SORGH_AS_0301 TaxID=3041780 RepID=UPI00277FE869|nr:oxygenase MpaB family protein [Rhodococcus sp. SORGH_AS_0301]MDQ1181809.1 hypothetical protein [Rhodococcus sp. SORGH_AS_0301]